MNSQKLDPQEHETLNAAIFQSEIIPQLASPEDYDDDDVKNSPSSEDLIITTETPKKNDTNQME